MEVNDPRLVEAFRAVTRRRGVHGKAPVRRTFALLLDIEAQDTARAQQVQELLALVRRLYPVCMNRLQLTERERDLVVAAIDAGKEAP